VELLVTSGWVWLRFCHDPSTTQPAESADCFGRDDRFLVVGCFVAKTQ